MHCGVNVEKEVRVNELIRDLRDLELDEKGKVFVSRKFQSFFKDRIK